MQCWKHTNNDENRYWCCNNNKREEKNFTLIKCSGLPAPEEAITGIETLRFTARKRGISNLRSTPMCIVIRKDNPNTRKEKGYPEFWPSWSIQLTNSSPAPSASTAWFDF